MASTAVKLLDLARRQQATLKRLLARSSAPVPVEADDVQGIVFRGYGQLKVCQYAFLKIQSPARARGFLATLAAGVSTGTATTRETALQIAFSPAGLSALGLSEQTLNGFSQSFLSGMAEAHRSRLLGDVGDSAPESWIWGGPKTELIHAVVFLYAVSESALARVYDEQKKSWSAAGYTEVYTLRANQSTSQEHFGFADGISQPAIEGYHRTNSRLHLIKAGEFVLGYPNEYGLLTERPLVLPTEPGADVLPADALGSGHKDLGRNGSYLVMRQLRQDVVAFRTTLDRLTSFPDGTSNVVAREQLAARIVGRWPSGAPLIKTPWKEEAAFAKENEFAYHHEDREGLLCPLGAHIRRANPRDALAPNPGSEDSLSVNRLHRLLRRGRGYGPELPPGTVDDQDRGLMFVALNANLARQFEFVQSSWLMDPHFNGFHGESDPLVGNADDNAFGVPSNPVRARYCGLPRFVTVAGGGYFFLPGIRALRYLASLS